MRGNNLDSVKDSSPEICKILQRNACYKIKDRHLGLWMGLVKLVSAFMLQNQRQTLWDFGWDL